MQYAAPLDTAQVCLTGLRISHIIGYIVPDYSNSTVTWEYKNVPTKDLRVVYFQFAYPTLGNEETCLFTKHESLQGDSPRVYPNILKCSLHSLVTKGIRLVGFATRAMVRESPTHCLILNSLAFARGRVILRSHFLILLLLIILISHHILLYFSLLQ